MTCATLGCLRLLNGEDVRPALRFLKLFAPPGHERYALLETLSAIIGPHDVIIVDMVKRQFHNVSIEAMVPRQGRKRGTPAMRTVLPVVREGNAVRLFEGLPGNVLAAGRGAEDVAN
jgi:hypothetical protein